MAEKWTCPECGFSANIETFPVHCACGAVVAKERVIIGAAKVGAKPRQLPRDWSGSCKKRWYRSNDLIADAQSLIHRIPRNIVRVVGVPRSGMIPAALIATHLHLPLYAVSNGTLVRCDAGDRMNGYKEPDGRTLLVEDSVGIGRRMAALSKQFALDKWTKLDVYVLPSTRHLVDIFAKEVAAPHLFEWNFFNGVFMKNSALDMDGIICRDGTNDAMYVPRNVPCRAIITARPENKRQDTETWLKTNGAQYHELIMWQGDPAKRDLHTQADFKATMIQQVGCDIYIESCPHLSNELRKRGIRVLCPQEGFLK